MLLLSSESRGFLAVIGWKAGWHSQFASSSLVKQIIAFATNITFLKCIIEITMHLSFLVIEVLIDKWLPESKLL